MQVMSRNWMCVSRKSLKKMGKRRRGKRRLGERRRGKRRLRERRRVHQLLQVKSPRKRRVSSS